jgi:hypothetical protein
MQTVYGELYNFFNGDIVKLLHGDRKIVRNFTHLGKTNKGFFLFILYNLLILIE